MWQQLLRRHRSSEPHRQMPSSNQSPKRVESPFVRSLLVIAQSTQIQQPASLPSMSPS